MDVFRNRSCKPPKSSRNKQTVSPAATSFIAAQEALGVTTLTQKENKLAFGSRVSGHQSRSFLLEKEAVRNEKS